MKHQPYCKPLSSKDNQFIDGLGPMEAIQMFDKCINPNTKESRLVGHALVYLLQHFLKLFQRAEQQQQRREQDDEEQEEEDDPPQGHDDTSNMMMMMRDAELQLHGICRAIIFHSTCIEGIIHMPGMCDYLFTTGHDILLSDQARFVKKHLNGYCSTSSLEPPTQEYINASIIDPREKDRVNEAIIELSALSTNKTPSCMQYCYGHYNLLIAAAVEGIPSHVSSNDGRGRLRLGNNDDTNLTIVAIRECLSLWTDPFIRASCGDAMAPAASLALTAIEEFTNEECSHLNELHGAEIAPGLDIDKAIVTCLMVIKEKALNVDYAIQVLVLVARSKKRITKPLWSGITLDRRAVVFLAIIDFIDDNWTERTFIFEVLTKLLSQSSDHLEIWERAAEDELLGPRRPGMNISLRAIAHHFIRTHTQKDGIHMVEAIGKVKSISLLYERNARTRKEKKLLSEMRTCKELAERIINI
jgi:hypothetical protein